MKKALVYAAALSAALICSACGNDSAVSDSTSNEDIVQTTETPQDNTTDTIDTASADAQTETENTQAENLTPKPLPEPEVAISIDTVSVEDEETAQDGTVIYSIRYDKPEVRIVGNDEAGEKINADIQDNIDTFLNASQLNKNSAMEYYEDTLTQTDYTFYGYEDELIFEVKRSDTNVISFMVTTYSFMGGAHGNYASYGLNYDASTGERLLFENLADDADAFKDATLSYNKELAATEEYRERMFDDEFLGENPIEEVLYAGNKWYFTYEELTFISNPYELGPYVAGTINFDIPYDKLKEMGLKEEYSLPDPD